jgi:DNA repair protein RecO (recombination protein O)
MVIETRGIVLRTVKYSETSLIADIFTEGVGLRSYIVSGVRQAKSKVSAGLLQVMSLVEIVGYDKPEKLNRLKEIRAAYVYSRLPFEIERAMVGTFMAEVARRTIRETGENAELFGFLYQVFSFLDTTEEPFVNLHVCFLLELSAHLGFRPHEEDFTEGAVFDLKEGIFTTETVGHSLFLNEKMSRILRGCLMTDWRDSHTLTLSREERRSLISELLRFYQFHIEGFPDIQSFKILQEVFS